MKINESGRSMIEMLGVLAIIGVLSVGGIAGYSKAMSKYRVNKTVDQISHIAANTRILFSTQKSYAALNDTAKAATIISHAKLFPDEVLNAGNKNAFAGNVKLSASKRFDGDTETTATAAGSEKAFVIEYDNIPAEACVDLLTIDWGTGTAGGIIALGTDSAVKDKLNSGCSAFSTPAVTGENPVAAKGYACGTMTVEQAVKACGDDNANTLYFKFY